MRKSVLSVVFWVQYGYYCYKYSSYDYLYNLGKKEGRKEGEKGGREEVKERKDGMKERRKEERSCQEWRGMGGSRE